MPSDYHHYTQIQTFCYYFYLQCSDSHLRPSGKPVPCNAEHGIIAYGRVNLSKCSACRISVGCIHPDISCLLQNTSRTVLRISRSLMIFSNSRLASSIRS